MSDKGLPVYIEMLEGGYAMITPEGADLLAAANSIAECWERMQAINSSAASLLSKSAQLNAALIEVRDILAKTQETGDVP